ncbi:hypothetical protein K3495_g1609 [Podosphaera aphanis]|nr:hypothetical protein K3495_g1609 [Podosphaera aphanis]
MRERTTYLFESDNLINPKDLKITNTSLVSAHPVVAAKEEKVTFTAEELPTEIKEVLLLSSELHIRWVAQQSYKTVSPWTSRISPGLHVFYTPKDDIQSSTVVCSTLKRAFGDIDCIDPEKSFTVFSSKAFSRSTSYQYYSPLHTLTNFTEFVQNTVCSQLSSDLAKHCVERINSFVSAQSLDISYSTMTHALTITSFTPTESQPLSLSLSTRDFQQGFHSRHEIGIFAPQPSRATGEISLGGFLTVLGDDTAPKPTLFSLFLRHHSSGAKFSARFLDPSGMHPNIELRISDSRPPDVDRACKLYAYLTLPRSIFVDKYQLADALFLANKNLTALHHMTDGVDLEKPEYDLSSWGSSVLIELAPLASKSSPPLHQTAIIPTHLRYLLPSTKSISQRTLEVPYPVVFWTCTAEEELESNVNPFNQVHMGYDDLFGPKTVFYHLNPESIRTDGRLIKSLQVPVLNLEQARYVSVCTVLAISLGFLWVIWCLLRVVTKMGYGSYHEKDLDKTKKEK